jgi:hypothetical protein
MACSRESSSWRSVVAIRADAGARDVHILLVGDPDARRSSARRTSSSLARMVSRAAWICSPASVARNQLLATSAAIDCRAYSKSASADAAWRELAARP